MKQYISRSEIAKQITCIFALTLISALSYAAGWNIDPLRIDLSPKQKTAALTITNSSDQPTTIQIQPLAWSQIDGKDVYIPTKELLVTPPIFTIAGKSSQIIRMALRIPADKSKELTYRINLQEIAPSKTENTTLVDVTMRVTIPVFIQPQSAKAEPKLAWSVTTEPDHLIKLVLENSGTAHIKITDLNLSSVGQEQVIVSETGANYILGGQAHTWMLKPATPQKISSERLHLKAFTDAVNVDTIIVVDKP